RPFLVGLHHVLDAEGLHDVTGCAETAGDVRIDGNIRARKPEHGRDVIDPERLGARHRRVLTRDQLFAERVCRILDVENLAQLGDALYEGIDGDELGARAIEWYGYVLADAVGWKQIGWNAELVGLLARAHVPFGSVMPFELDQDKVGPGRNHALEARIVV